MADYPREIRETAVRAIDVERFRDPGYDGIVSGDPADLASAVLDAVAADLGQHVAAKIYEHRDNYGDRMADPARARARRRDLGIAAQVAAKAFLTEDDKLRMTAEALIAGNYVACFDGATDERSTRLKLPRSPISGREMNPADVVGPAPEDSDGH